MLRKAVLMSVLVVVLYALHLFVVRSVHLGELLGGNAGDHLLQGFTGSVLALALFAAFLVAIYVKREKIIAYFLIGSSSVLAMAAFVSSLVGIITNGSPNGWVAFIVVAPIILVITEIIVFTLLPETVKDWEKLEPQHAFTRNLRMFLGYGFAQLVGFMTFMIL